VGPNNPFFYFLLEFCFFISEVENLVSILHIKLHYHELSSHAEFFQRISYIIFFHINEKGGEYLEDLHTQDWNIDVMGGNKPVLVLIQSRKDLV